MTLPTVTPMTVADLDAVMLIERQAFKQPWSRHMYLMDLTQNHQATYLVVRSAPDIVLAYGGFWLMVDEAHIGTVATHPDCRGSGLGTWLMLALLDAARQRGAVRSTLEVRAGNLAARQLYEKLGYQEVGYRRHYYQDGEDALIMTTPPLADPDLQAQLAVVRAEAMVRLEARFGDE
jgi:ribosomal-protein-alanine N-acetyltransferase